MQYQEEQYRGEDARMAGAKQGSGGAEEEDEYMRRYVHKAMQVGQKLGLDKLERNDLQKAAEGSRRQPLEAESSHYRKETLTLSGTLSGVTTSYGMGTGPGLQGHESASSNFGPPNLLSSTDRQQFYQHSKDQRTSAT